MKKTYFALGGILAAVVLFLVLGAAAPAPVQRNQFTTNVAGAVVLGPVAFDGAVNIAGASTHGSNAAFTNAVQIQGAATITGATGVGGTLTVSNALQVNGVANIVGASTHGGTATFTNGTVNQGTANVTGAVGVGGTLTASNALVVGGTANVTGASFLGGTLTLTNGSVNQGTAKITGETDIGGTVIVTNIVQANNIVITNNGSLSFGTNATAPDVSLMRGFVPSTLEQRNGTNPQTNAIYNTFTDSGNYEKAETAWDTGALYVGRVQKAGTGATRSVVMGSGNAMGDLYLDAGTGRNHHFRRSVTIDWTINTSGHFVAGTDNTVTIGATNATRPSIVYIASGLVLGASGSMLTNILTGRAVLDFPSTAASSSSDLSITVTGATTNDVASVQAPPVTQLANSAFTCFASNNTVYVRFSNFQAVGALDPGAASFSVIVHRF